MTKNILFDDWLAKQMTDVKFRKAFDTESTKIESKLSLTDKTKSKKSKTAKHCLR